MFIEQNKLQVIVKWRCGLAESGGIANYFSLWGPRPVLGSRGGENRRQVQLFVGVAAGAAAKAIYDAAVNGNAPHWSALVVALIASFVIFPQLYYVGGLDKRKMSFAHWMLAFQNGFFWSVALSQIAEKMGSAATTT